MQVARYRERHSTSGAKSDPADAHLLAEIVRQDRAHHRPVAGDSEIAEHVKVAARAHQTMIWSRVRQANSLRSMLREYYPAALTAFGTELAGREALAVLTVAPTPDQGRRLSQARIESLLRKAGRQRNVTATAAKIRAVGIEAVDRPARGGGCLCGQRVGVDRGVVGDGRTDRSAGQAGGAGFWPAPG
ncbi:MAG: IS110 family transposase, partial [Propionibacteriaceae bacterium]